VPARLGSGCRSRSTPARLSRNAGRIGCGKTLSSQADNLRHLKALYIDCGEKDQFNLLYGARRFVRRLNELGTAHRYGGIPDSHSGVDYRMDESLPFLVEALSG
jgi:hypothetical protein